MRDAADAVPAVELAGVTKTYRLDRQPLRRLLGRPRPGSSFDALRGVSLRVARGGRLGIVGRNGAGKTTLLKLLTGNFAPTGGRVTVNGSVQALMQIGLGFHDEFTGYENARSALLYNGVSGAALDAALADVVEFCELGEFLHQPVSTYSLGMRVRLQFAAATAVRPDILVIDEIMGAGDAYFSAKSAERMKRLTASGCTLLLVSHSPYQVLEFCDRAMWLEAGAIRMEGEAHEVLGAYEVMLEKLQSTSGVSEHAPAQERLEDGREVFRWPGKTGIKVAGLRLTDGASEIEATPAGGKVKLEMQVRAQRPGTYSCAYLITLWNERMRRVSRVEGHDDGFTLREGERRSVEVDLSPFLLGGDAYHLSVSVYDRSGAQQAGRETRFDVLMRCLRLRVTDRPAPPFFEHPATWTFG